MEEETVSQGSQTAPLGGGGGKDMDSRSQQRAKPCQQGDFRVLVFLNVAEKSMGSLP